MLGRAAPPSAAADMAGLRPSCGELHLSTQHGGKEIALSSNAAQHDVHREGGELDAFLDLEPRKGRRNAGRRRRPHGVHAGQRAAPGVLVVVDQHPAVWTLGDAILRGEYLRVAALPASSKMLWRTSRHPSERARASEGRTHGRPSTRWSLRTLGASRRRAQP